jgi:hypothetical protein
MHVENVDISETGYSALSALLAGVKDYILKAIFATALAYSYYLYYL